MREDVRFLLWAGEKALAGDSLTEEELRRFAEARERQKDFAHRIFRLKPEDYRYEKGRPFPD